MADSSIVDKAAAPALAKVAAADDKRSVIDEKHSFEDGSDVPPVYNGSDIVPGSLGVTYEELNTLRHVSDRLPFTAWLVVVVEFAERWSYYGTTNIISNYVRAKLPEGSRDGSVPKGDRGSGIAGALGMGQQKAFAIKTFNTFLVYCTPWIGGIIADTYWGRYKTILVFSIVCFVGHVILVGSASPPAIEHSNGALAGLIIAIIVMSLGAGSIKANVSPMIAEQYTGQLRKETLKSGEVVIKSPALTVQSIYNFFYAAINFGSVGAISASFLARDHGFWKAFLVPTAIFLLVPIVLAVGNKNYIKTPPRGSILIEVLRVFTISAAARWSINPVQTVRNFRQPGFWDTAKPSSYPPGQHPSRITWDDEFVGEVARTFKACKVFLFFPFFWLCYSQIDNNLGTVAAGMTLNGTPNDLIQNLNPISIIVLIPIFEFGIYPGLRRIGINFTPIKRIYAGFLVAGLAMLYAAILQKFVFESSPCHDNRPSECETDEGKPNPSPINVWVVAGPYILVGISEIFASITSLEYAFTKAPKRMKSVVMAFSQFQTALSSALNFALTAVNVEYRFTWLFGSFAVTAWVIGTIFFLTFRQLDRDETRLNAIGQGNRAGFEGEGEDSARRA